MRVSCLPVGLVSGPALATQSTVAPVHHVGQGESARAAFDGSGQLQQASLRPHGLACRRNSNSNCGEKETKTERDQLVLFQLLTSQLHHIFIVRLQSTALDTHHCHSKGCDFFILYVFYRFIGCRVPNFRH